MADKPDVAVFLEPTSTRRLLEWTPPLIRAARAMADAGNLELAADFCESAMGDDRVQAALSTRTKGLVALPIRFEAARTGSKRAIKALEADEDWWVAFDETALSQLLNWGILLGVGLARIVWTVRTNVDRIVPKIEVWNPRHLRYDWDRRVWTVKVAGGGIEDVVPGDGKWILYTPYGTSRPWAFGVWRAIALWHLLKQFAIQDWAYYSAKNGGGHLVATSDINAKVSKEDRKSLAADLFAMQANSAVALPPGVSLDLIESTADTSGTFEAQKNAADLGMSVSLLGQNLSTEVTGPVSTGATLHGKVLQVFIDADAQTITTCIHDQALVWWAEFNFGARDIAPWPILDTKPPENRKAEADVLSVVSAALNVFQNAGAPVDVRALLERFGVPLKDPKDIEQSGQVFKYHLDYGVLTLNEVRERLGLPPVSNGDVPPVPVAAPADPNAVPDPNADTNSDPNAKATMADYVQLASGRIVRRSSGVAAGQEYVDGLADNAKARAIKVLDEDLVAVLEAINEATSFDDVKTRLEKVYKGMNSDALAKLAEATITMAHLGGRHAINEDL
jgi:phage gp29-like protein